MSSDPCTGFFCNPANLAGGIVLSVLALIFLSVWVRQLIINRERRARGLEKLPFSAVINARMRAKDMRTAGSDRIDEVRELRRQMDWEKEQATHEMMRTGQPVQRQLCAVHDRWCFHAWEDDHPPGGFNNPKVPDDWPPDLTKPPRKT